MTQTQYPRGVEVVGSGIIENEEGKILLVKCPKWNNKWTMPGGHVEPGEAIEQALLREIEEETGLSLKSDGVMAFGELIGSKDFPRLAHFIYFDILCQTDSTEVKIDNEELTDYDWVTPEEGLRMDLAESYDKTIRDYIEYKNK